MRSVEQRPVPPLLRRILLVNAVPLVLLVVALLYLDQYQSGLLAAEVAALRQQAQVFAGALAESAVRTVASQPPALAPDLARPLLIRLTAPVPNADARVYVPDGQLLADSRIEQAPGGAIVTAPLAPPAETGPFLTAVGWVYDRLEGLLPYSASAPLVQNGPGGVNWAPDFKTVQGLIAGARKGEPPAFIRRTPERQLLVSVTEPVMQGSQLLGIVLLTSEAQTVVNSLFAVRLSILGFFLLALGLTVITSVYLSRTIARPILRLALAAERMREGHGRSGAVPTALIKRRDEIGVLAAALRDSAAALWARLDANERFAADVAHEIRNPLSSIRSAIETVPRISDRVQQNRLFRIMADDVARLDRLIGDISDASRLDAELSRRAIEPIDIAPMLIGLGELYEATHEPGGPHVKVVAPSEGLVVQGLEDRLIQVLRNLIGNAISFSPPEGVIALHGKTAGGTVEIAVEDEGPGIPEATLEHIFDRFYSERPNSEAFGHHSGLGLSISRQIVTALKGKISAENRRNAEGRVVGARFVVRLPQAPPLTREQKRNEREATEGNDPRG